MRRSGCALAPTPAARTRLNAHRGRTKARASGCAVMRESPAAARARTGRRPMRVTRLPPAIAGGARPLRPAVPGVRLAGAAHRARRQRDELLRALPDRRQAAGGPGLVAAAQGELAEHIDDIENPARAQSRGTASPPSAPARRTRPSRPPARRSAAPAPPHRRPRAGHHPGREVQRRQAAAGRGDRARAHGTARRPPARRPAPPTAWSSGRCRPACRRAGPSRASSSVPEHCAPISLAQRVELQPVEQRALVLGDGAGVDAAAEQHRVGFVGELERLLRLRRSRRSST